MSVLNALEGLDKELMSEKAQYDYIVRLYEMMVPPNEALERLGSLQTWLRSLLCTNFRVNGSRNSQIISISSQARFVHETDAVLQCCKVK